MMDKIKLAIQEVKNLVIQGGNQQDIQYFLFHEARFEFMANSVSKLLEPGAEILEMGSHYLHSSLILSKLGFKVFAMDVDAFWDIPFVENRGRDNHIEKIVENDLETLHSQDHVEEKYDCILFTEIFEHITFNPIHFWKRVYNCSKDGGKIYMSTPNSFALPSLLRAIKNILLFKGMGLGVDQIFSNVTYGHHWKEYSTHEIKSYFSKLSGDFKVSIRKYSYKKTDSSTSSNLAWSYLTAFGNFTYFFASDIEAVISIEKSDDQWLVQSPEY